jgi:hypothetical protein
LSQEQELTVAPDFFHAYSARQPLIGGAHIEVKRGPIHNELARFRYDVVLRVGKAAGADPEVAALDWQQAGLNLHRLRELLSAGQPAGLIVRRIPNARVWSDMMTAAKLAQPGDLSTVHNLRDWEAGVNGSGVDPEHLWQLSDEQSYSVSLHWGSDPGSYDAAFGAQGGHAPAPVDVPGLERDPKSDVWSEYTNDPLLGRWLQALGTRLRHYLQSQLPDYLVPSAIVWLERLPLTPNGKIDRRALPGPDGARPELEAVYVAPHTELEQIIAAIWREALQTERVGVHDSFFDLGGHSLLLVRIHSQLQEKLQRAIPIVALFQHFTISRLAAYLTEGVALRPRSPQTDRSQRRSQQAEQRQAARQDRQTFRRQQRSTRRPGGGQP